MRLKLKERLARKLLLVAALLLLVSLATLAVETGTEVGMRPPDFTLTGFDVEGDVEINLYTEIQENRVVVLYFFFNAS